MARQEDTIQVAARIEMLRVAERHCGQIKWSAFHDAGINFQTVYSGVKRGYLNEMSPYHYELTQKALAVLAENGGLIFSSIKMRRT